MSRPGNPPPGQKSHGVLRQNKPSGADILGMASTSRRARRV